MPADILTDMVEMLTNVNQYIDQDLVDILTDSETTCRPRGAFSTQDNYKKFIIMHYLFCGQI